MSTEKQKRVGKLDCHMPAYAAATARWQLDQINTNIKDCSWYPRISARIFTAFMFEGVIHELGKILFHKWDGKKYDVKQRHRDVRERLSLSREGPEYNKICNLIGKVFDFRDNFAHPKILTQEINDKESNKSPLPLVGWQKDLLNGNLRTEFEQIFAYCQSLIDRTADKLDEIEKLQWSNSAEYYDIATKRYPHLGFDFGYISSQVRVMLTFLESGSYSSS